MPKRSDIHTILIIGSGPIVIGQACEFDYSGTQACKALRDEGFRVVLVNSNPATIMTDPEFADATYIEPLTREYLEAIIAQEKPEAILPTMGGQTALNLALTLAERGVLEKYHVELIGANVEAIRMAEDRQLFKEAMLRIGLQVPTSSYVQTIAEANEVVETIGLPAIIRPAFTLGGSGGSIAYTADEYESAVEWGLAQSPIHKVLIEQSVLGWKEFELEVVRDRNDNVVIICSIENFDPMGIHTGDSITVAPALTLTDKEFQRLRDAAIAIMREIGVDTGGSNVQFAINPRTGELVVVEMNPRVSRSSALASKATGYPIAKIAAKLAVGYTLDELPNDIAEGTSAAFEPVIDYVVTKIPRFAFEKFPGTSPLLSTQMKSVGEVMAIGRTFTESLHKAVRSLEIGPLGFPHTTPEVQAMSDAELIEILRSPRADRVWWIMHALRRAMPIDNIHDATAIDPWFLQELAQIPAMEMALAQSPLDAAILLRAKQLGFSDVSIAELTGRTFAEIANLRAEQKITPTFCMVDTCAAEFPATTPYLYSTYHGSATNVEAAPTANKKIAIIGSGPNRIGQGIEFDYCCVQAVFALRAQHIETLMLNCNPETVSTDYDTADRLYFEPLTAEDVLAVLAREHVDGVIVQFGGQTPLKLAHALHAARIPILGTSVADIDAAEDREQFHALIEQLHLRQPHSATARTLDAACAIARDLQFPLLVRPSYVLGGRAMRIAHDATQFREYVTNAFAVAPEHPVLIDRYLQGAIEVDVDCISDGRDVRIVGVMEHVEEAGIHSGDSSCSLPAFSLSPKILAEIEHAAESLARALKVVGLLNVQCAVVGDKVFIIEANPRASRTVPFVAKATGVPVVQIATRVMLGESLATLLPQMPTQQHFAVKSPVFPFVKFPGVDSLLGPEMQSTGEVMGIDTDFASAFLRAQIAAGNALPTSGCVCFSVRDDDKSACVALAQMLLQRGFTLAATNGTARYFRERGLAVTRVNKVGEGSPHTVDAVRTKQFAMIINTVTEDRQIIADSFSIRRSALECAVAHVTTLSAAKAAVAAMTRATPTMTTVRSIQAWCRKEPA